MIANARMYAVSPEMEAAWQAVLGRIAAEAGLPVDYMPYPAPQPLELLWDRPDLGCVFMCGYPIALGMGRIVPIAAPIPSADWADGRAVYRSDLIVRADAPYATLEQTFGARVGWTVAHSHSGFNALRHHLLRHRTPERPRLYAESVGNLITARGVIDAVLDGRIDIGPLDAYWHSLIAAARPELVAGFRVLESTDLAPIPSLVASDRMPAETIATLRTAFAAAGDTDWFAPFAATLRITGFAPVDAASFATTLAWDWEAKAAGYPIPR